MANVTVATMLHGAQLGSLLRDERMHEARQTEGSDVRFSAPAGCAAFTAPAGAEMLHVLFEELLRDFLPDGSAKAVDEGA
jgi:hypothetical protein